MVYLKMVTCLRYLCLLIVVVARVQSSDYKIVCYYNYWSNYYTSNGKFQVDNIDPSLCTHLVYAYVGISSCSDVMILDPQLQGGESYRGREDFKRFTGLKKQNRNLKFLVAFGGYNGDHEGFFRIIRVPEKRRNFIRSVHNFMHDYGFDGVSLDYYRYYPSDAEKNNFIELLEELKRVLKEGQIIAVAASAIGTKIHDYYNFQKIAEIVDFISLVSYDYYGPTWSNNKTGFVAPLYGRKLQNGQEDTLNQHATVYALLNQNNVENVDPKKLILGMPTYGRSFTLANNRTRNVGDNTTGAATIGPYTNSAGFFTYSELVNYIFRNNHNWCKEWDGEQEVPFAYKDNLWISYENERSFSRKAHYIKKMNLGGAMINSIDSDDFLNNSYPLIRTVKKILNETESSTSPPSIPSTADPIGTFECTKEGLFTNFQNCTEFYTCVSQPDGSFAKFKQSCQRDLFFDESVCQCNYPEQVAACNNPGDNASEGCIPEEWVSNLENKAL